MIIIYVFIDAYHSPVRLLNLALNQGYKNAKFQACIYVRLSFILIFTLLVRIRIEFLTFFDV